MTPETFDVYRTRHFHAVESIDIARERGNTSPWTAEILVTCPTLRRFSASTLHAEDILQANKPWICHHRKMVVFIDMGFQD